jgi:hypothetical protein
MGWGRPRRQRSTSRLKAPKARLGRQAFQARKVRKAITARQDWRDHRGLPGRKGQ